MSPEDFSSAALRSVAQLVPLLNAEDPMYRVFAAEELGELKDPTAITPLIQTLTALTFERETDFGLACACVRALGLLGDSSAIEILLSTFEATLGDDVVPLEVLDALVALQATDCLTKLRGWRSDLKFEDYAYELDEIIKRLESE